MKKTVGHNIPKTSKKYTRHHFFLKTTHEIERKLCTQKQHRKTNSSSVGENKLQPRN